MKPNPPPPAPAPNPADPEARLTAFLLGELTPAESAEVQRELEAKPEFARLHTRLARTIEFVREATRPPAETTGSTAAQPRLSNERREALLAAFKTVRPFASRAEWSAFWHERRRMALALAAGVMVLLAVGLVFVRRAAMQTEALVAARSTAEEARLLGEQLSVGRDGEGRVVTFMTPDGRTVARGPAAPSSEVQLDAVTRAAVQTSEDQLSRRGRVQADDELVIANGAAKFRRTANAPATPFAMGQAGSPGLQGGTAPATEPRMLMRYGLTPQAPAATELGKAWGEYDNDFGSSVARNVAPPSPASGAAAALMKSKSSNLGAAEVKAAGQAAPVNVLADWFALATNRAVESELGNGALGYTFDASRGDALQQNWAFEPNRTFGGFAVQRARLGSSGGLTAGGMGGGGMRGGGMGGFGGGSGGTGSAGPVNAPEGEPSPRPDSVSASSRAVRSLEASPSAGESTGTALTVAMDAFAPVVVAAAQPSVAVPETPAVPQPQGLSHGVAPKPAAGVPVLGDVPTLGRAFRPTASRGELAAEGAEAGGRRSGAATAPGRPKALGLEAARQTEELAPLPLQLPVPAFMGTPTDIPLAAGALEVKARVEADFDRAGKEDRPTLTPSDAKAPQPARAAANATLATVAAAAEPAPVAAGKPAEPAAQNLYFMELDDKSEVRQQVKVLDGLVERDTDAVFSKGVPALRVEVATPTTLAREKALVPSTRGVAPAKAEMEELRRKLPVVRDLKDAGAGDRIEAEVAAKGVADERLAEVERYTDAEKAGLQAVPAQAAPAAPAAPAARPALPPPVPQPEIATAENSFSTFSLNVADVSFKLAAASLNAGNLPEPGTIRVEEFINAFDYRDPAPVAGAPISFAWERAQYPFAHNREVLRFSIQTAAQGREAGRPLNLVLLLDNSGSMERADRVSIIREALRVLGGELQPQDKISVVTFARNARLWVDALPGNRGDELLARVGDLSPEGGTNLEEALRAAYEAARRHFLTDGVNRVILLTDGAANLGDVSPDSLKRMVEEQRRRGVALDCFGIGWDGYNDELLETLSHNGDGRYGFVNSAEEVATGFANQLAGALQVAAADVKAQVEFNPARVTNWRQIGYAKHQLTKEQFRDNTVDAAELGAAEAGNALYVIEVNPQGQGPLGFMRVRYRVPGTGQYREHEWALEYNGPAVSQERASASMRLATTAAAFGEMLSGNPYAAEVNATGLLSLLGDAPRAFDPDPRPAQLASMLRQAQSIGGR